MTQSKFTIDSNEHWWQNHVGSLKTINLFKIRYFTLKIPQDNLIKHFKYGCARWQNIPWEMVEWVLKFCYIVYSKTLISRYIYRTIAVTGVYYCLFYLQMRSFWFQCHAKYLAHPTWGLQDM